MSTDDRDDVTWSVRVSASTRDKALVYTRQHRFEVGAPLAFDVEDDHVSAFEYMLGALGADLVAGMKRLCHRRRLDVDNVEALVVGKLDNALTHLGVVGEEGHPGLEGLTIKVFVESLEDEEDIREVWELMLERSPLYRTFAAAVRVDLRLQTVM